MRGSDAVVPVPRLLSSSVGMWLSVVAAFLVTPAALVWALLTRPAGFSVVGVVIAVAAMLLLGGVIARRTWLDPVRGELVREVWGDRIVMLDGFGQVPRPPYP